MPFEVHASERAARAVRCPFCHEDVGEWDTVAVCSQCGAKLHAACFEEGKECAACRETEPMPEEPVARVAERRPRDAARPLALALLSVPLILVVVTITMISRTKAEPMPFRAFSNPWPRLEAEEAAIRAREREAREAPWLAREIEQRERRERHIARARVLEEARDLDGAIACLEDADLPWHAWKRLVEAREERGDVDGAIADCTKAIEKWSYVPGFHYKRSSLRERQGDIAGAVADMKEASQLGGRLDSWNYDLAEMGKRRDASGDVDGAILCLEAYEEIYPDKSKYMPIEQRTELLAELRTVRAREREKKGDLDGALADLDRAIALDPRLCYRQVNYAEHWLDRSRIRERKGDREGAISDLESFLKLRPAHAPAREKLAALRAR